MSNEEYRTYCTARNPREIVTVTGQDVRLRVRRHQLEIIDGFPLEGPQETHRVTRATSRVNRLLFLAGSGVVTVDALDWCAENGVPVVAADQSGEPRWTILPGASGAWQAALRRSQVLAPFTDTGLEIARWLVRRKIEGQRDVLRDLAGRLDHLPRDAWPHTAVPGAAVALDVLLPHMDRAATIAEVRQVEADAAVIYWSAWCGVPLHFAPPSYKKRVPEHWRTFAGRGSPLTRGNRNAADPWNATINYAYSLLEVEAKLACHEAGLDLYLGVLHTDQDTRRSFVYDVMEPVRTVADRLVLTLLLSHAFRPGELWALRDGRCRLDQDLCAKLWPWMSAFRRALGPVMTFLLSRLRRGPRYGERTAFQLVEIAPPVRTRAPLGQKRWAVEMPPPPIQSAGVCRSCGALLEGQPDRRLCDDCLPAQTERFIRSGPETLRRLREMGQDPAHGGPARAGRAERIAEHNAARRRWNNAQHQQATLDAATFTQDILPGLRGATVRQIARALGVSEGYASFIRRGLRIPHERLWERAFDLAQQVLRRR